MWWRGDQKCHADPYAPEYLVQMVTLHCGPTREVEEVALPQDRPMKGAQEDC